jgi:transcription termination factor Rho
MMDLEELKKKKLADLYETAKTLNIDNYSGKKKQDLILSILEAEAKA